MPRVKKQIADQGKALSGADSVLQDFNGLVKSVERDELPLKDPSIKLSHVKDTLSIKLKTNIAEISETLLKSVDDLVSRFEQASKLLTSLTESKVKQEGIWELEKQDAKKAGLREEEEYQYQMKRRRQMENDQWEQEKAKRELTIAQKEKELKESDEELKELRNKDKMFEARLAKAVNDAIEEAKREGEQEFAHKEELLKSEFNAARVVLEAKVESLAAQLSLAKSEIERVNKQIDSANARLTEIASGAVRTFRSQAQFKESPTDK